MNRLNNVHFIGIGGISMSAIAKVLMANGVKVSGSDSGSSAIIDDLEKKGAVIYKGHSGENIKNPDLVVYTAAIKDDNPELISAREKGIETIARADMLGRIMKNYKKAISVAGTHGKTTATSMFAYVLMKSELDPTVMVGGELDILGGNLNIGQSEYFLTESCEYCRSFLSFFPTVAIILNVDEDHLDYYKDIDDIKSAFRDFASLIPENGILTVCADSRNALDCMEKAKAKPLTYGIENGTYRACDITYDDFGFPSFTIKKDGEELASLTLNVRGVHNVLNATGVFATCMEMGLSIENIKLGLESFKGTKRRFEKKGTYNGALIIDDYAHHPAEIEATLLSAKKIRHNRIWCIFQPHTYTRTKALFDEFKKSLSLFDKVIVADIYAAREKDTGEIHSSALAGVIDGAIYIPSFTEIADYVKKNAQDGDIIITMGAGNIVEVADLIQNK